MAASASMYWEMHLQGTYSYLSALGHIDRAGSQGFGAADDIDTQRSEWHMWGRLTK